jgi:hypothetical protein
MDKLPKSIHRFLVSTTSRLTGEFNSPDISIGAEKRDAAR